MITVRAVALAACLLDAGASPAATVRWTTLQRGVEYATTPVRAALPIAVADTRLHLVRVTPAVAEIKVLVASQLDRRSRTAAAWSTRHRLAVAINLGMYHGNGRHVGYLRAGRHIDSGRWLPSYHSLLVLGPARILDRDAEQAPSVDGYSAVVQNLRLIRSRDGKRGEGVWTQQEKRWSEAALAIDRAGRLLFVFCRAPLSMWELNRLLLELPLGVVRAMHMEGGPEASLSIHAGGVDLDLCGSFETGFFASDLNRRQWPLPNVLGVVRR